MMVALVIIRYFLLLRCVCLAQNMPLISVANLCSMAFTLVVPFAFSLVFVHHTKMTSILKHGMSNVTQNYLVTSRYTHWGVTYAKFHKALHTW